MDPVRAGRMAQDLVGQSIGGWIILRHIGSGKSAVVFEGKKNGKRAALKIFDPELIEKYGKPTQLVRINRERNLIGDHHPHLVQIFDGGECTESGHLFVAMEFVDAPNLMDSIEELPRERIPLILYQIASAARFLEEKQLVHRDIKPENIAVINDYSHAILLDLGVLRPFGDPGLTDEDARVFVGTLRYSSPEFLLRTESDTVEGWRAITFYQLGAVLHDLIMRRPLFEEFSEPFAMLVEAVKSEKPEIQASDLHPDLVLLSQNCLVKRPTARLSLVTWKDFEQLSAKRKSSSSAKDRAKRRSLLLRSQLQGKFTVQKQSYRQIAKQVTTHLDSIIRNECVGSDSCPPMQLILDGNNPIQVTATFAASPRHALSQQLSIRFVCEIIDETLMALSITSSACLLPKNASHGNPPTYATVFKGPIDSDALIARIQNTIWISIDLAQRQESLSADSNGVLWLNLNQELEG